MELKQLRGLGPARLALLQKAGIETLYDLLMVLPASYRDTTRITPIQEIEPGTFCCVQGNLKDAPKASYYGGKSRATATLADASGALSLVWFNQPWVAKSYAAGQQLLLSGVPEQDKQGRLRMYSPKRETEQKLIPEYRSIAGISSAVFSKLMSQALTMLDACCPETLPPELRQRYGLCERNFALRQIHQPESREMLQIAQRRMAFEQLLLYQAALSMLRGMPGNAHPLIISDETGKSYWQSLPFPPTGAQVRVFEEIRADLGKTTAMRRMVQGDVGCGKTAIAFAAMYCCAQAGRQSALMAPTEILARQHLESAQKALEPLGVRCGLLIGGMKAKERREALEAIRTGQWHVVIGTHALLSEGVEYRDLSLVITDEQHRFGVEQRHKLSLKATEGLEPHVLVMSATPIPRSLALILYGDLDISVVDELPPGRTPVKTHIVPESKREGLYDFIKKQARDGWQTYIVCPLVEESEAVEAKSAQDVYAELCNGPLSSLRLGLTYGAQDAAEKDRTLTAFSQGKLDVLVSTTVIEVGVNVPRATVMVIENADRFGLSQLHQLRGRVGRGAQESWCFLLAEPNERLKALCATNDGFEIARKDLELRGPGEFLGTAQHGQGAFALLASDGRLIADTQHCLKWLNNDPAQAEAWQMVLSSAQSLFREQLRKTVLN
ncbi:MAG: ATP-dependent DNA helicase RecG [Clostridia bacterium]|nr:ATP-dependent DNA helicase RecG [Clostridia bacterium]